MGATQQQLAQLPERRGEVRYPCVGIALIHSAVAGGDVAGLGRMLHDAAVRDMSLQGLAFDVDTSLEPGQALIVLVEQPNGGAHERLIGRVRGCTKTADGVYRVGVRIEAAEVGSDDPREHISFPVGVGAAVPVGADMLCPACGSHATFRLSGLQQVDRGAAGMPLYDCGNCGTTRTITSILTHSRRQAAIALPANEAKPTKEMA